MQTLASVLQAADVRAALTDAAQARGIRTDGGWPVRFVAPDDTGVGASERPYEVHIAETGRVPTRENLHDLFNALAWLAFPRAKAALNAVQARVIEREGVGNRRGPLRDAATLIDESGLLLASPDPAVFQALAAHDWRRLLIHDRERWGRDILPVVIGHALLEQLNRPFKGITAALVPLPLPANSATPQPALLDGAAAAFVRRPDLTPRDLLRLPVLGIPGWDPANSAPGFYDDAKVFRPARLREVGPPHPPG
jgi:hypothetical protein